MRTYAEARKLTLEERMEIVRGLMKEIWKTVVRQTKDWDDKEVPEMPVYAYSEDEELNVEVYFVDGKCDHIKLKALTDGSTSSRSVNMEEEYTVLLKNGEEFHRCTPEGKLIGSDNSMFCEKGLLRIEDIALKVEKLVFDEEMAKNLKPVYIATFDDIPLAEAEKRIASGFPRR